MAAPEQKIAFTSEPEGVKDSSRPSSPLLNQRRRSGVGWTVKYEDVDSDKTAKVVSKVYDKVHTEWKKKAKDPTNAEEVRRISKLVERIPVEKLDINSALIQAAQNPATTFNISLFTS